MGLPTPCGLVSQVGLCFPTALCFGQLRLHWSLPLLALHVSSPGGRVQTRKQVYVLFVETENLCLPISEMLKVAPHFTEEESKSLKS